MAIHKSGLTVTEVDIPNGDADSYTLSSKTIVKSGVPYLVQMNPAAADEEGPPVFDIQVIGKSGPIGLLNVIRSMRKPYVRCLLVCTNRLSRRKIKLNRFPL